MEAWRTFADPNSKAASKTHPTFVMALTMQVHNNKQQQHKHTIIYINNRETGTTRFTWGRRTSFARAAGVQRRLEDIRDGTTRHAHTTFALFYAIIASDSGNGFQEATGGREQHLVASVTTRATGGGVRTDRQHNIHGRDLSLTGTTSFSWRVCWFLKSCQTFNNCFSFRTIVLQNCSSYGMYVIISFHNIIGPLTIIRLFIKGDVKLFRHTGNCSWQT